MTDYVVGSKSFFNDDAKFFKDVYIYGHLYYDLSVGIGTTTLTVNNITVEGDGKFKGDVYIDGNLNVGILTVRKRLDVGIGGTVIRAIADFDGLPFSSGKVGIGNTNPTQVLDVIGTAVISNRVGIGSINPQQKLDVAGSVKIDENIYDSINNPGRNGYELVRDDGGIRWIPLIAEPRSDVPGIGTDGIFVLDEGVPLYPR